MINKDIENTEALLNALHEENMARRAGLRDRKRIVVKVGSSSLLHSTTKRLDYHKIDVLVRELSDLKNRGKDVILVSSGATAENRGRSQSGRGQPDHGQTGLRCHRPGPSHDDLPALL